MSRREWAARLGNTMHVVVAGVVLCAALGNLVLPASSASAAAPVSLPPNVQRVVARPLECLARALRPDIARLGPTVLIHMDTDCAGIEAPAIALRQLQDAFRGIDINFVVRHRFPCELLPECQRYIRAFIEPEHMFGDVLAREWRNGSCWCPDVLDNDRLAELPVDVDLYVVGFSCEPWSTRHVQSACFFDDGAKIFFAARAYILHGRPKIAVLENVQGLARKDPESSDGASCLDRILTELRSIPGYSMVYTVLDPSDFNYPLRRSRYWFVMHRLDATLPDAGAKFLSRVDSAKVTCTSTLFDYV